MRSIKGSNSCRWSMVVLAPQAYGGSTTVSNMCSKTFWTRSSFPARVSNRRSSNICSGGFHEPVRSALVPSSGRRPNGPSRCRRPRRWPPSPGDRDALGRPDIVGGPEGGTPRGTDSPTRRPESRAASRPPRDATGGSGTASPSRAGAAPPRASGPHRAPPVELRRLAAVSCLTLAAVMVIALGIAATGFAGAPGGTTTATVQTGQSLWEVAAQTGTGDVGETVTRIVELNGLTSSSVEPGQVLVVPVE